ncbi:MAG: endonuclease/exonuclease/phosphatase family protein [Puniceicoccaceae bacterium]
MRRLLLVFLFVLASAIPAGADDIRVATMNLLNYLVQDRWTEGRWRPDYPKPESEKAALRRAVVEIDPDVLALQEMGPAPFLKEFREDLAEDGVEYPHAIHFEANDENRHLALLSKIAPVEVRRHVEMDFPYFGERLEMKRGLLEVVFPVPASEGKTWSLFVVHLKSRWSDQPDDPNSQERRTKEAQAARNRILDRFPEGGGLYLIAGDFNDHRDSAPLRRFLKRGDVEISRIVEAFDSRREKWTYFFKKKEIYERVDFFLASLEMSRFVAGEGTVFDPLYVREGSDHRPVYLDLRFGEGRTGSARE